MQKNIWYIIFTVLLWIIFGTLVSIIIWGLNKGFDLTDEGFNMLSFLNDQENVLKIYPIYQIIGKLTTSFEPGIFFFRISRLLLLLLSAFIFVFGFIKWVRSVIQIPLTLSISFIYPITGIATLMNYAIFYQGLSYNSLVLIHVQIIAGLFLWYLSYTHKDERKLIRITALLFFLGFFLGLLFLIKFPTAVFLSIAFIGVFLFFELFSIIKRPASFFLNSFAVVCGFLFFVLLITAFYASPLTIIRGIIDSMEYFPGHDSIQLIKIYIDDFYYNFIKTIVLGHPIIIIGPVIMWLGLRYSNNKLFMLSTIIVFSFITKDVILYEYYKAGMDYLYSASALYRMFFLFSIILILLITIDKRTRDLLIPIIKNAKILFSGLCLLLALPFVCSFGTSSALSLHLTQFVFSWVLMFLVILFVLFSKINYAKYLFPFVVIMIMVNSSVQILFGFIYSPYRLIKPLTEQKYTVPELPVDNNMMFDFETSIFLNRVVKKLKEYHFLVNGQPIITLYNYPGLTYLLGGLSPGSAWYADDGYLDNTNSNCFRIRSSQMRNIDKSVIFLEDNYTISEKLIECLRRKGIAFPEKYKFIDSIPKPDGNGNLLLYIPLSDSVII